MSEEVNFLIGKSATFWKGVLFILFISVIFALSS